MVAQGGKPQDKPEPKVKHFMLAKVIKEFVSRLPNVADWSLVNIKGRMNVRVKVEESEEKS